MAKKSSFYLSLLAGTLLIQVVGIGDVTSRALGLQRFESIKINPPDALTTPQQRVFGAEDPILNPVTVPIEVLKVLQTDSRNRTCLKQNQSPREILASWFVASEITLKNDRRSDLLVMSTNPCLNGANLVPFWIFRKNQRRYMLALKTTALALKILETQTKTYRDIETTALSASTEYRRTYKFDGKIYRRRGYSEKPVNR